MIEHKIFDLKKFKNLEDAEKEMDNLSNYEGWLAVCPVGKDNNKILMRRILEDIPQPQQQPQQQPQPQQRKGRGGKPVMFPNAVYQ